MPQHVWSKMPGKLSAPNHKMLVVTAGLEFRDQRFKVLLQVKVTSPFHPYKLGNELDVYLPSRVIALCRGLCVFVSIESCWDGKDVP
jgi:hypothetical protein